MQQELTKNRAPPLRKDHGSNHNEMESPRCVAKSLIVRDHLLSENQEKRDSLARRPWVARLPQPGSLANHCESTVFPGSFAGLRPAKICMPLTGCL